MRACEVSVYFLTRFSVDTMMTIMKYFSKHRRKYFLVIVLLLLLQLYFAHSKVKNISGKTHPVILIPGDGGSQLEATLNKPSVVHYFCEKKSEGYFDIWLNLELLVPYILDCWVDNMRLQYNNITRKTSNAPGVDIRVPGFGNTTTVEWLDPSKASPGAYFTTIVETLVTLGFERGYSIRAAPYDFRKAPNEHEEFFITFQKLVEETYLKNSKVPVVLIAHSMGSPFMLYFLNRMSQSWKDQHIRALITLAGCWGGAVKAMRVFASGDNLGIFVLSAHTLRAEQRTSSSLSFLMPSDKFWAPDEVLISTPQRNYTIKDYWQFFKDIDFMDGYEMWKDTKDLIYDLEPPGVEVHCLHGINVSTDEIATYPKNNFPDGPPVIVGGNGDGTVNLRSLAGCLQWQGKQKQKVYYKTFPNVDHMSILSDKGIVDYISTFMKFA